MRVRSELGGFTNSHLTFFFHVSQDLSQAGTRSEHLLVIDFRFGEQNRGPLRLRNLSSKFVSSP